MVKFVRVCVGQFVYGLLMTSVRDSFGRRVLNEFIVVVKEESVFFAPWETGHWWLCVCGSLTSEMVASVVAKVENCFM
jgi:hypothetical protein